MRDSIRSGEEIGQGQHITSYNSGYRGIMQPDGNFVIYNSAHVIHQNAIWSTGTANKSSFVPPFRLVMQPDANLVLYDGYSRPLWATSTQLKGSPPHRLVMQDDGNLVVYDALNQPTWASGSKR